MQKKCVICNKDFVKSPKISYKQFSVKKTCSKECFSISISGKNNNHYGVSSWNKGGTSWSKGKKFSVLHRAKISLGNTGKKRSEQTKLKLSLKKSGKERPELKGKNCHFWKGGVTSINASIRASLEYRLWRKAVFERDSHTCQLCKKTGGKLNADHIKPFSLYPDLRLVLSNGRTLCVTCHKKTDTYGGKIIKLIS